MRLNFRQGLVSFLKDSGNPRFLQESGSNSAFVSHVVSPTATMAAFAHGASDYLQTFDTTVDLAWGPMTSGVDNYLYWDIDLLTSNVSRGITTLIPVTALTAPPSPAHDQHWFDLSTTTMKVWDAAQSKWRAKVRLFAGRVVGGNTDNIIMYTEGSQVGLTTPSNPGYIVLDTLLQPIRKSVGEFLTDDDFSRVRSTVGTGGVLVQPTNRVIPIRAGEAIPRMSLVYFSGPDIVRLASSNPGLMPARVPVGVVIDDIANGDVGTLVVGGEITHDQWNWSGHEGKPLYCDDYGQITITRPSGLMAYRIGFVKNAQTVLFNVDAETFPQVYTSDVNTLVIAGVTPIQISDVVNGLGERVVTISAPDASAATRGFMTPALYNQVQGFDVRITNAEDEIIDLQVGKADVGHQHLQSDVTGLPAALAALTSAVEAKTDKVVGAATGNFAALDSTGNLTDSGSKPADFALAAHFHTIPDVTGLQDALNLKSDVGHTHIIANVTGLQTALDSKINVGTMFPISQVTSLQTELDNRAFASHTHSISNVTGLQSELDNRAYASHTHSISNVTGLQAALDGKAALVHGHAIADVTGLQAELDDRAFVVHTHSISNVTGLQTELNARLRTDNTTAYTPTADYHPATKKYVDDNAFAIGSIDQHTDVDTSSSPPAAGNALVWNGTQWVPGVISMGPSGLPTSVVSYGSVLPPA